MNTYHEFDKDGRNYRVVYDDQYPLTVLFAETRGRYDYETEEEMRAAEDEEIAKLESGEWVVLGCIVTSPDPCQKRKHCADCRRENRTKQDDCWGFVVENNIKIVEALMLECF